MLNGRHGISDPDLVREAMRATGLSQVTFARMLGTAQSTISGWVNGKPMGKWEHGLVSRLRMVPPDSARVLHLLVHSGREYDALGVCLGAPAPVLGEAES